MFQLTPLEGILIHFPPFYTLISREFQCLIFKTITFMSNSFFQITEEESSSAFENQSEGTNQTHFWYILNSIFNFLHSSPQGENNVMMRS